MLIWTARVSKKTKAVVAVILAGILAAAVLLLVGRSGGGQDAAAWQLTGNADPHRLSGVHGLAGGGGTGGDAAVSAAGGNWEEPYLTYNELQDSQGFDLSACCGKQVARYTYTVTNYPGRPEGVQAQPLCLRGAAGGRGYPLRRGRRIPGHTGLSGAGLSPFGMACGQKKNCRNAAVLFLG